MGIEIRKCTAEDIPVLYTLTRELIEYHGMLDIFTLTEDRLKELIESSAVQSCIAYADGTPCGNINFFYKYTTFSGRKIIYLEDLYVREQFRSAGIGRMFFELLRRIAKKNDCERIEWKCAEFNQSGMRFYEKLGAAPENVWKTYTIERKDF